MNNSLYFIDMRYSNSGHYIDDLKQFNFLSERYTCHYIAPGDLSLAEVDKCSIRCHGIDSMLSFYIKIFWILLLKRDGRIVFLSCSYMQLLVLSLISFNFKYRFRVHSLPMVRQVLYKRIIGFLSKHTLNTIFLDWPVMDFFVKNGISDKDKSKCVIGRVINNYMEGDNILISRKEFTLTYIGALNEEKDLLPVLVGLKENPVAGLNLNFYSKGISKYRSELISLKEIYPNIIVSDEFLSRRVYDEIISRSDALILPYKNSYGVRFSAVLNDALNQGKPVLTINLPQFNFYKEKYHACQLYNDKNDVSEAITKLILCNKIDLFGLTRDYSAFIQARQIKELGL